MRSVTDSELIDLMGGPAKLAAVLGFDTKAGGVQRVYNWRARGIPAAVKLRHRETFLAAQTAVGSGISAHGQASAEVAGVHP
jgi:hypothetical protein